MKRITFKNHSTKLCLVGTLLLMTSSLVSCDLDDNEDPILIIEPPTGGFIIDEDGIPRRDHTTELSSDEQKLIDQEVIGHGWKWLHSYEINKEGALVYENYYEENPTARCCNYYFASATEMTTYSYVYGAEHPGHVNWPITIDHNNGDVRLNVPDNDYFLLNILSVFRLDGRWYICTIERLGMNGNGLGMYYPGGFVYSEYVRMTNDELENYQKTYSFDWSMIN